MSFVRQSLADQGLSSQAIDIIFDSWRSSTKKQYLSYIHKWILFCQKNNFDLVTTEATYVVEFLTELYSKGLTYSTINTARSALSTFLGVASSTNIGSQALVTRFMKGVARNRPTLPRYKNIWDVNLVLNVFRQQPLVEYLSLYDLTLRTVTLLALVSAQRCQSLHLLDLDCMTVLEDRYEFLLSGNFKQSRAGCETLLVSLPAFREDIRLCIFNTLTVYLNRTKSLRTGSKLFISVVKPHTAVSKDTIARWIKALLKIAGVDVNVFSAHSTRAAATSTAHRKGVAIASILQVAGWSNVQTFAKFYNKPLVLQSDTSFTDAVLRKWNIYCCILDWYVWIDSTLTEYMMLSLFRCLLISWVLSAPATLKSHGLPCRLVIG